MAVAEEGKLTIRPKSVGRGIMVSDFITEHSGYLTLTDEEHKQAKQHTDFFPRLLFKYGAQGEGYWNSETFLVQMEDTL